MAAASHDFFFLFDASVLVNGDDLVRDVGRFLRIGAEDADLQEVSVTNFINLQFVAQTLIGLDASFNAVFEWCDQG